MDDDSMILKEELDPNYEPTQDEILEYAEYVGLELPEDEDLLYLVREGLKAPLPEPWKPCKTKDNWYSIVECKKGRARWAANFYIYAPPQYRHLKLVPFLRFLYLC